MSLPVPAATPTTSTTLYPTMTDADLRSQLLAHDMFTHPVHAVYVLGLVAGLLWLFSPMQRLRIPVLAMMAAIIVYYVAELAITIRSINGLSRQELELRYDSIRTQRTPIDPYA